MNFRKRALQKAVPTPTGRRRGIPYLAISVLALGLAGGQLTAQAGIPIGLPVDISGNDAVWEDVQNTSGTSNGDPVGGSTNGSPGFGVDDARLVSAGQSDAFDTGMTLWVNNEIYVAPSNPTITPNLVSGGPMLMSGLNVSAEYYALTSSPTLRMLGTFQNPTDGPITVTVTLATNLGSDSNTTIAGTSSGDTAFTAADRWIVTDDSSPASGDPAVTHFLSSAGSALQPSSVSNTVFSDVGTEGVLANYQLTVPAFTTRRLLFFVQLNSSSANGVTNAAAFAAGLNGASEALTGISEAEQGQIVNFNFGAVAEGGPVRVFGTGVAQIGRVRGVLNVHVQRTLNGRVGGSLTYTEPRLRSIRGYQITEVTREGNTVTITGLARFSGGNTAAGPFTAVIVDNGPSGDQFSISGGGINIGLLTVRGNLRIQP